MSQLVCESRILRSLPLGDVIEISFQGTHECTHGGEMHRYVVQKVAENRPSAVVFNLLDYHYVFGNDVTALFTAALDQEAKEPRPVYIAATGVTHKSLFNLFKGGKIQEAFGIEFVESVEAALQRLGAGVRDDSV